MGRDMKVGCLWCRRLAPFLSSCVWLALWDKPLVWPGWEWGQEQHVVSFPPSGWQCWGHLSGGVAGRGWDWVPLQGQSAQEAKVWQSKHCHRWDKGTALGVTLHLMGYLLLVHCTVLPLWQHRNMHMPSRQCKEATLWQRPAAPWAGLCQAPQAGWQPNEELAAETGHQQILVCLLCAQMTPWLKALVLSKGRMDN